MAMKNLFFLIGIIIVFAFPSFAKAAQFEAQKYSLGNGIELVKSIETSSPNALCKTQSHKLSIVQGGDEKAWTKLTATNGCWSACISLGNSTRTKGADSGWTVTWGTSSLGGFSCTITEKTRHTYAHVNGPGGSDQFLTYQRLWMRVTDPLDFNWAGWSQPE